LEGRREWRRTVRTRLPRHFSARFLLQNSLGLQEALAQQQRSPPARSHMSGRPCCAHMQRVMHLVQRARAVAELQPCRGVRGASRSAAPAPPRLRGRGGAVASAADASSEAPAASAAAPPPPEARVKKSKLRLDALAMEQHPQYSRTLIQSWILQARSPRTQPQPPRGADGLRRARCWWTARRRARLAFPCPPQRLFRSQPRTQSALPTALSRSLALTRARAGTCAARATSWRLRWTDSALM